MSGEDDLSEAEERVWCAERRDEVVQYLSEQPGERGGIGAWPAWFIAPYVSIWAVESLLAPGCVGWWVICGDLPCDYCIAERPAHPRNAMRQFGDSWAAALASYRPGDAEIGETGLPGWLAEDFRLRVEMLRDWTEDEGLWEES